MCVLQTSKIYWDFFSQAYTFASNNAFMKRHLLHYAQYNLWANQRMVDLFREAGETIVNAPVVSSFPSIRATLLHLWDVEVLWLERLQGNSPRDFPSKTFTGNNEDIFNNLVEASTKFVQFIENQPDSYFNENISFGMLTVAGTQEQTPADMIHHCMNHQTMHRGQLITMARQLGITTFPRTDYIIWAREN
jgi:uncharacterized damage-inducible protein DinB